MGKSAGKSKFRELLEAGATLDKENGEFLRYRRKRKEWDGPTLCEEQKAAAEAIRACEDTAVVLTGCAGSGKSTVIKYLLHEYPHEFAVCATTGKAALLVGGPTVDSLFKFRRGDWSVPSPTKQGISLSACPRFIIIDEASMIGAHMADVLYEAAVSYNKTLVLVGDWAQASPVKDDWPFKRKLFKDTKVLNLRENHRQNEGLFYDMLNRIRLGDTAADIAYYFATRVVQDFEDEDAVRLLGTNEAARRENDQHLQRHARAQGLVTVKIVAKVQDKRPEKLRRAWPMDDRRRQQLLDNSQRLHEQSIALGCRILLTRNDPESGVVNGDTGDLEDFEVRLPNGKLQQFSELSPELQAKVESSQVECLQVRVDREEVGIVDVPIGEIGSVSDEGEVDYIVKGFPAKLGYALTIHKAQGMTIPKIWVDMDSIDRFPTMESRHGLAYVALSRVRDVTNLYLGSWNTNAIYCEPSVKWLIEG